MFKTLFGNRGERPKQALETKRIEIKGMTCDRCVKTIKKALLTKAAVKEVRIDRETGVVLGIYVPAEDDSMLDHYGVTTRQSRSWQTVTPVALPLVRRHGRVSGSERVDEQAENLRRRRGAKRIGRRVPTRRLLAADRFFEFSAVQAAEPFDRGAL